MQMTFYRSLDRRMVLFGLRGEWVRMFLICAGAGAGLAVLVGLVFGTSYGIALFIVALVGSFFGCLVIQGNIPGRRLHKVRTKSKCSFLVRRRELISRHLLENPDYELLARNNQ